MAADGLVWVLRRNGRWWPGQVLRPEEFPGSLPSPKEGTPIKLLCKEDASVDWYNVEKSAKVKAFRCGEYDKCIEKAKASLASNSSKKIVKYVTREDAILRALEIEGAGLEKDHPGICSEIKNEEEQHTVEDSPISLDPHGDIGVKDDSNNPGNDSETEQEIMQSFEGPNVSGAYEQEYLQSYPNDSEDDGKGVQRMKGLDDLGMDVVSSLKRKRSHVAHVHEFLKRKHRRRTVTKNLHSTEVINIPITCEELDHPTKSLPLGSSVRILPGSESDVIKRKFSLEENGASFDGLCDVPIVTTEEHFAGGCLPYNDSQRGLTGDGTKFSQSRQVETVIFREVEDVNESGSTSSEAAEINDIWPRIPNGFLSDGTSKWQLKKKRSKNTSRRRRHSSIKFMDVNDEYDPCVAGTGRVVDFKPLIGCPPPDNIRHCVDSKAVADIQVDVCAGWSRNTSHKDPCIDQSANELQIQQRLLPYRQSRFSVNPKYQGFSLGHQTVDSSLFDVNLEVRVNYRPRHVPYVSLMSKLSGRPVVGHPLALEVLEDGICDDGLGGSDYYSDSWELDDDSGDNTSGLGDMELDLGARSNSGGKVLVKKIKRLSSLTRAHKQSEDKKLIVDKLRGPSLACIPLTIVFSRINEALTGSNRPAYRQ